MGEFRRFAHGVGVIRVDHVPPTYLPRIFQIGRKWAQVGRREQCRPRGTCHPAPIVAERRVWGDAA